MGVVNTKEYWADGSGAMQAGFEFVPHTSLVMHWITEAWLWLVWKFLSTAAQINVVGKGIRLLHCLASLFLPVQEWG